MMLSKAGSSYKSAFITYVSIVVFTSLIVGVLLYINGNSLIGIDDANIYLVYMRNFAHGYGFVYNPGGEHVEGFTSLLWTLVGSLFFCFTSNPESILLIFNILIVSFATWGLCRYINSFFEARPFFSSPVILFLGLMLFLPGYFEWSVLSLMETGLWSSVLILSALNFLRFEPGDDYNKAAVLIPIKALQ